MRALLAVASLVALLLAGSVTAQRRPATLAPVTAAERSGFAATATADELRTFLEAVVALAPPGRFAIEGFGTSEAGRDMLAVDVPPSRATSSDDPPLRVLVVANIHAGEVCGKEAVQILLREIAQGEHAGITATCHLRVVPNYNVDGNEAVSPRNRVSQNGPIQGVGRRENELGLDLNRDCVKAESAEFRALLGLMRAFDPHVVFDLHTTDGSPHGYHVTYATSQCTNVDPQLDAYARNELLLATRARLLERHGFRSFDYGNVEGGGQPSWSSFDHTPRYLTNYVGLRNRISLLSEAYAYDPFEVRVRSTRAFVLAALDRLVADRARIAALCAAADRICAEGRVTPGFGTDTILAEGEEGEVLWGTWDALPTEGGRARLVRRTEFEPRRMTIRTRFVSRAFRPLPAGGWAVITPSEGTLRNLRDHGIAFRELTSDTTATASSFVPTSGDRAARPFQGHRTITLRGEWRDGPRAFPAGTIVVPSRQPLARLAAQLLEPESEDGLATWEFFAERTVIASAKRDGEYPVVRLATLDALPLR
ncbi:MAG: hypothetical protein HZB39_14235 [Planctomycetes bacterium]|nr:hypothetical protein [Planctomycetota bacterium]